MKPRHSVYRVTFEDLSFSSRKRFKSYDYQTLGEALEAFFSVSNRFHPVLSRLCDVDNSDNVVTSLFGDKKFDNLLW